MEQFFNGLSDVLMNSWGQITAILAIPVGGGLTIWGIIKIILSLITKKNAVKEKFTELLKENKELQGQIDELKVAVADIPNQLQACLTADREARKKNQKKLYESVMAGEDKMEQIAENVSRETISVVEPVIEEVEETIEEVKEEQNNGITIVSKTYGE